MDNSQRYTGVTHLTTGNRNIKFTGNSFNQPGLKFWGCWVTAGWWQTGLYTTRILILPLWPTPGTTNQRWVWDCIHQSEASISPSLFCASHQYSPSSSRLTLLIWNSAPRPISSWSLYHRYSCTVHKSHGTLRTAALQTCTAGLALASHFISRTSPSTRRVTSPTMITFTEGGWFTVNCLEMFTELRGCSKITSKLCNFGGLDSVC